MSSPGYDYFPFFIAKVRNKNFENNFEWQAKFVINFAFVLFFIRESVYEIKMCVEVQLLGIEDVYLIE